MSTTRYGDGFEYLLIDAGTQAAPGSGIKDMRDVESIGAQLITTGTLAGAWKVEVSNNYVPAGNGGGAYGQESGDGTPTWTDITAQFSPAIAAVTGAADATQNQYAQADLTCRAVKYTFTPSGGTGTFSCFVYTKSWS